MVTLESWAQEWESAGQYGTVEQRTERTKLWFPYYSYLAGQQRKKPFPPPGQPDGFVGDLLGGGMLRSGDSVLDIGAGTGGYALEFARHCKSVTALEPCAPCLDVLGEHAAACGLDNVRSICELWENYRCPERFDVVFSSMCPAICGVDQLRRMEDVSARVCCLVTVMRGSVDKHRRAMMAGLGIRPKGMVTEALYYYNALYLMGRQPNVICRTTHRAYDVDEETVLTQYPIYFKIFGVDEEASTAYLKRYLSEHAEHGVLHDESTLKQAMITWSRE
ncbi:MAG: class I SAM-dependent methyltransferase [Oscillospiraceae bacterium]|nr:class I SAM-dependent methyltransferase [Oscillospiraceae bacterium]